MTEKLNLIIDHSKNVLLIQNKSNERYYYCKCIFNVRR